MSTDKNIGDCKNCNSHIQQIEAIDASIKDVVKSHFVQVPKYSKYGGYEGAKETLTIQIAKSLYEEGYRKQRAGTWKTSVLACAGAMAGAMRAYSHICSECGYFYKTWKPNGSKFCPDCGATMTKTEGDK